MNLTHSPSPGIASGSKRVSLSTVRSKPEDARLSEIVIRPFINLLGFEDGAPQKRQLAVGGRN
jgi:hypothetical protein